MYAIKTILGEHAVFIDAGSAIRADDSSVLVFPDVRIVLFVRLTNINSIGLEEGWVHREVEVLNTVATVHGLSGPFVFSGLGQHSAMEIKRLLVGNMDVDEAVALAKNCGAELLIPCHIKMFAGNDPAEEISAEYCIGQGVNTLLPEAGKEFAL